MTGDALTEFQDWMVTAKPGERYIYASGIHVMGDTSRSATDKAWMDQVEPVRRAALAACVAGNVVLFQKRNGNGFDYYAQRKDTSKKQWPRE